MSAADAPRDLAWAVAWARLAIDTPRPPSANGNHSAQFPVDALRLLLGAAEDAGRLEQRVNGLAEAGQHWFSEYRSAYLDGAKLALHVWTHVPHIHCEGGNVCAEKCPRRWAREVLERAGWRERGWPTEYGYWCALHKQPIHGPGTAYATCPECDAIDAARAGAGEGR